MFFFKLWAFILLITFQMKLIEFKVLYKALNSIGKKIKVTRPSYLPEEFRTYGNRYAEFTILFEFNNKWIACGTREYQHVSWKIERRFVGLTSDLPNRILFCAGDCYCSRMKTMEEDARNKRKVDAEREAAYDIMKQL